MKYELINSINPLLTTKQQILKNRGIKLEDIDHYLYTTDNDINDYWLLGKESIKKILRAILLTVKSEQDALVIVDCDADGFGSSALLINYLYDLFPHWIENHLSWFIHENKEHGLADLPIDNINENIKLILVPDAGSNDYTQHKQLADKGITVCIMDHHEAPHISENAITVNNQLCDYPNKQFCGGGIVWQVCRAFDELLGVSYAEKYIDLAALTNISDMMSLTSIETKHVIQNGLKCITNPFFYYMCQQNAYSIGDIVTPIGVAFYVTPYINSVIRSGTMEEKQIVFRSFLQYEAFKMIPSTKRGHDGEEEEVVVQAIRVAQAVKRRQKKAEDEGMRLLEDLIEDLDMLKDPVLIFTLEKDSIEPNIRGLAANKIASKYQKPTLVTVRTMRGENEVYAGSARCFSGCEIQNFKDLVEQSGLVNYAQGHQQAFGVELPVENLDKLQIYFKEKFTNISTEPVYFVDYIFNPQQIISAESILEIADMKELWGQDLNEPLLAIENIPLDFTTISILARDKNPTLKLTPCYGVDIMYFGLTEEQVDFLDNIEVGKWTVTVIGTCARNEWNGRITAQIIVKDWEFKEQKKKYIF